MYLEDDEDEIESKKIKLPTTLIISEGNKYLRLSKFEKAISSFQKILECDPNNIQALLGRAKSYMKLAKYKEAWQDFQHVLKINPKCTEAVYLKGVIEYQRGNFEKGFITYRQGYERRPFCDDLKKGYEMCKKAIDNNLNADTPLLLTHEDVNKMSMFFQSKDSSVKDKSHRTKTYEAKGLYAPDLKLLEDMIKDKTLTSIQPLCKDLFEYLTGRQKFWKMQEPRIKNKLNSSRTVKGSICDLLKINRLIRNFSICKAALKDGKTEICFKKGNKVLVALDNLPFECFPEKSEMKAETLHYLGLVYLIEGDITSALALHEEQLNIAKENDMKDAQRRALLDMGEAHYSDLNFEKAADCFQQSLKFVTSEAEESTLLYKISDCYTHLNKLEAAQSIALKCLEFAIKSQDHRFKFDILLLLGETAVKSKDMKVAEQHYSHAFEVAIQNHDARQKDIENLLKVFDDAEGKESYSTEIIKIGKMTEDIKHSAMSETTR